ncbi:tetratricopeptide repeat protein [Elongatibacter sediminis]|uniref:Tetratricopeptide repeat protein n=1 Tax=Elongatibacter sediminis TaxID=3119006 RepID=A0AAW9R6P7_9GAMM
MSKSKTLSCLLLLALLLCFQGPALAQLDPDVQRLQKRWAEINYQLAGKTQETAFKSLVEEAEQVTQAHPDQAEAWIWSGIIKSTYAGAKGGLGALKYAKASRKELEHALDLDSDALQGSAYTSLGTLYYSVPGWPVGFGNDEKAESLLLKALDINPDGIDSNYFYGSFLLDQKRYEEARKFLMQARSAAPRPDRPIADAGRQEEIALALLEVEKQLSP